MRRTKRSLLAAFLLAVLMAPLGGVLGAGLLSGGIEACVCGMPGGECCCELIARSFKQGESCDVSGGKGAFCGVERNRPMPLPERNLANLDLRWVPVEGPERRVDAPLATFGAVTEAALVVPKPLLDPPDPPPPRSSRKHA